jgi:hypothetical protein
MCGSSGDVGAACGGTWWRAGWGDMTAPSWLKMRGTSMRAMVCHACLGVHSSSDGGRGASGIEGDGGIDVVVDEEREREVERREGRVDEGGRVCTAGHGEDEAETSRDRRCGGVAAALLESTRSTDDERAAAGDLSPQLYFAPGVSIV